MDYDQLKMAAIKACELRQLNPHEEIDSVVRGEYQGKAPRWTIVARELQELEPLLLAIMYAHQQLPRQGDPL